MSTGVRWLWPRAWGEPTVQARLRSQPEDFWVCEQLGFEPTGAGEHAFLRIRKRGLTSEQVARGLACYAGVTRRVVSYAGMKDKQAATEQWFSVHLPGQRGPDWTGLDLAGCELVVATRHNRKLKRGALRGNRFRLRLREVTDGGVLQQRWDRVIKGGVPNYFGPQRFGLDGANVEAARRLFLGDGAEDRFRRGLYLSAARAWLFNSVLAQRVSDGSWDCCLPGELLQLEGSHSVFAVSESTSDIRRRLEECDVHPTGPLWGGGEPGVGAAVVGLEQAAVATEPVLCDGLVRAGLRQERRSLRVSVRAAALEWIAPDEAILSFSLPAGCYATSVVRELVAPQAPWDAI